MNNFPNNPISRVKHILKKKYRRLASQEELKDALPKFPGGKRALINYLEQEMTKPKADYPVKNVGSVYLNFVIDKQGKIMDIKIMKSLNFACNYEAFRLVKNMPSWRPALRNGKATAFRTSLVINF